MASPFTDDLAEAAIARTAKEALRATPGDTTALRRLETFRFTEYHEPLRRWPFVSEPVRRKVRSHGSFPPLSSTGGAGGLTRTELLTPWRRSPSERIGSNFSPASKRLSVVGIRDWKVARRAAIKEERGRKIEVVRTYNIYCSVLYCS